VSSCWLSICFAEIEMRKKFIFIKDIEDFLKRGQTQVDLPERTRLSPAAWDLVREKGIRISFKDTASQEAVNSQDVKSDKNNNEKQMEAPKPGLVAVASAGRDISGVVGQVAARSPYFLLFDTSGRFIDIIKNPFSAGGESVGLKIANLLAASQVSAIAAEKFGRAIKNNLKEKDIHYFELSGSIQEAVDTVLGRNS
jgi:predicted Fe-Mo cluster-binding NifX family protein